MIKTIPDSEYKNKNKYDVNGIVKEEKNNKEEDIISILKEYMEGELKADSGEKIDVSYEWVQKDQNINILNRSIQSDLNNIKDITERRDACCELKLIKLMTEDKIHRDKFIELPKEFKKFNRYPDILPYDYNRVYLNEDRNIPNNYFNGSYISGPLPEDKELFISTQGPLPTTIETFWKIIIKKNIKLVIMLSNLEEQGRKKCDKYWPDQLDTSIIFEKFQIELENQDFIVEDSVLQRCFIVHDEEKGTKYSITQLHVVCWPDHNAPEKEIGFKMIELLISFVDNYRICYKNSPILVHCSAGIGRTGTFLAIYNLYKSLSFLSNCNKSKKSKILPFFSVFNTVRKLREQRFGMITDSSQYKYVYEFITEWLIRNYEA